MHILRIIIIITILSVVGYNISDRFRVAIDQKIEWLFPCRDIITYSINTVDAEFGITKPEFISMLMVAENVWEKAANKNLFEYEAENGKVTINLIYDARQASTDKLKNLGYVIHNDKESFDNLKEKYDLLKANLLNDRSQLELDIASLKENQAVLESEIEYWNNRGGAPKSEYNKLEARRVTLNQRADNLNERQLKINEVVDTVNSLGTVLNDMIYNLNLDVAKYNNNQDSLGEELDQGEYRLDENGRFINIYQFDSKEKLTRVLTHELGHALGLSHNNNESSIMYKINQGKTLTLSPEDVSSLKDVCRLN